MNFKAKNKPIAEIYFGDERDAETTTDKMYFTQAEPIAVGVSSAELHKERNMDLPLHVRNLVTMRQLGNSYKATVGSYLQEHSLSSTVSKKPVAIGPAIDQPGVREKAKDVKDFYRERFMVDKLSGIEINAFNTDVFEYVTRDNDGTFKTSEIGLISSLPQLYQCDTELNRCFAMCDVSDPHDRDLHIATDQRLMSGYPIHGSVDAELIGGVRPMGDRYELMLYFREVETKRLIQVPQEGDCLIDLFIDMASKSPYFTVNMQNARVLNSRNNFIVNARRAQIGSSAYVR
jgi:hypothetical protein